MCPKGWDVFDALEVRCAATCACTALLRYSRYSSTSCPVLLQRMRTHLLRKALAQVDPIHAQLDPPPLLLRAAPPCTQSKVG